MDKTCQENQEKYPRYIYYILGCIALFLIPTLLCAIIYFDEYRTPNSAVQPHKQSYTVSILKGL
jgi:hypothetical protein